MFYNLVEMRLIICNLQLKFNELANKVRTSYGGNITSSRGFDKGNYANGGNYSNGGNYFSGGNYADCSSKAGGNWCGVTGQTPFFGRGRGSRAPGAAGPPRSFSFVIISVFSFE